jgi:hypothetical protein
VEFEAQHAVADIPQAGRAIARDRACAQPDVGQHLDTGRTNDVAPGTIGSEILPASVGDAIEAGLSHPF